MQKLNLPSVDLKIKSKENKLFIFDPFRKKEILLTPEEWVRQHVANYLVYHKNYPISLTVLERELILNNTKKRTDIVIYNTLGTPEIIVECKASSVKITQQVFDQIARYNLKLNANYLIVTNGLEHYFCQMDFKNERYVFLKDIPNYTTK
ncbi:type I restriction enzyme HsdR N-terminal domain-containing protein [Wenyingzhuangia sp. 2_MG-2023]|uniref:type I restriction enzyme HsdR N-terminal domain-containing protein n=1 Tax=Wenyingzhuangia sp. 2_MG-2023 TaxID=3062639 RepID=UPI0026E15D0B|nr:type I restriction enzyme HsdR N-terminal domain-containing protein [Wenyingzhuangia sp. 2_MG-2023]MDO6738554.1 type I restriction enzyme HsdR N-terminal domain-containing protein [Wenyingzhuangia sp. 2_MG-2023]MDO6803223.1 type I restriction enzyme HsdR N-terminal domain-containing protein [Wenyingzhuangia sp. 1_MG-2023]